MTLPPCSSLKWLRSALSRRTITPPALSLSLSLCDPVATSKIQLFLGGTELLAGMAMAATAPLSTAWNEAVEKVIDVPLEKAWVIAGDFLGFPSQHIDKVENVKGENGLPGCQRKFLYKNQKSGQNFVVEELTAIDAASHKVSYSLVTTDEIVEPGQESYIQLSSESEGKTRIKWPFRFASTQVDAEMLSQIYQHLFNTWIGELERRAREL